MTSEDPSFSNDGIVGASPSSAVFVNGVSGVAEPSDGEYKVPKAPE